MSVTLLCILPASPLAVVQRMCASGSTPARNLSALRASPLFPSALPSRQGFCILFFQPDSRFYYFPCSYFPAFPVFLPLLGLLCRPDFLAFQLRPFRAMFNGQNPSRLPLAIHHLSPPPLPRKKKNKKKKLISCKSMEQKASKLQLSSGLSHAHVRTRL